MATIIAPPTNPALTELWASLHSHRMPERVLLLFNELNDNQPARMVAYTAQFSAVAEGKTATEAGAVYDASGPEIRYQALVADLSAVVRATGGTDGLVSEIILLATRRSTARA